MQMSVEASLRAEGASEVGGALPSSDPGWVEIPQLEIILVAGSWDFERKKAIFWQLL